MEQPASTSIPITTGADGQPYIGADAFVAFLHALSETCSRAVNTPEDIAHFAEAMRVEADALQVRAIAHTTRA